MGERRGRRDGQRRRRLRHEGGSNVIYRYQKVFFLGLLKQTSLLRLILMAEHIGLPCGKNCREHQNTDGKLFVTD